MTDSVAAIQPGASMTFAMTLEVPSELAVGSYGLAWGFPGYINTCVTPVEVR